MCQCIFLHNLLQSYSNISISWIAKMFMVSRIYRTLNWNKAVHLWLYNSQTEGHLRISFWTDDCSSVVLSLHRGKYLQYGIILEHLHISISFSHALQSRLEIRSRRRKNKPYSSQSIFSPHPQRPGSEFGLLQSSQNKYPTHQGNTENELYHFNRVKWCSSNLKFTAENMAAGPIYHGG